MADSASEVDLESDTSSVDGLFVRDTPAKCDQLQRRVDLLQQENKVLKTEVETLKLKVRSLNEANQQLRKNSVNIQAKAEQEEEYISNMLQRRISELKKEKESLAVNYEQEEECLTNELNKKLMQLQKEKELLERTLAKEQETQVNKLKRRIEKLESEKNAKQQSLDKLRIEKIELENALEQEQEALVNRLWKKMDKLEAEKRLLQEKLESASAPLSGSSSVQNLYTTASGVPQHSVSVCMGAIAASNLHASLRLPVNQKQLASTLQQQQPKSEARQTSFDSFEFCGSGCQSNGNSPSNLQYEGLGAPQLSCSSTGRMPSSSLSPLRPPQSPMDTDTNDNTQRIPPDFMMGTTSLSKSDHSLPSRGSFGALIRGPLLPPPTHLDSVTGAAYVARLRDEVYRLRAIVTNNQSDHMARMGVFEREERIVAEENQRLKRLLQAELDKKEALSRQFSGSESSLEMEDERQFNEASRGVIPSGRFRTTSDGCPSPHHPSLHAHYVGPCAAGGNLYGPGYAYATAMAASNSRSVSPRYCRECGQSISNRNGGGGLMTSPRGVLPSSTPPHPPASPTSTTNGGRFIKPRPLSFVAQSRSGDKATTPRQNSHPFVATKDDDEEDEDDEDDRCRTPPSVAP